MRLIDADELKHIKNSKGTIWIKWDYYKMRKVFGYSL